MMSRTLRRSLLDVRIPTSALPPTFLLPLRARFFNSTPQIVDSPPDAVHIAQSRPTAVPISASNPPPVTAPPTDNSPLIAPEPPVELSASTKALLPHLLSQPNHYITAHIHARPYLVTAGDVVRLPFHMPGVEPGDILRLNRASAIGSRDYTLKGAPYIDERLFVCRATVLGTEGEPVRVKVKKKQRNRRTKTVYSKHKFTVMRISELRVRSLEEVEAGESETSP